MEKTYSWFGIDFGTTNSAAIAYTGDDKETIRPISYGDDEGRPMASAIAINRNTGKVITGREAKDQRNVLSEDYEYIPSVKLPACSGIISGMLQDQNGPALILLRKFLKP